MSANISYVPNRPKTGFDIYTTAPQSFIQKVEEALGINSLGGAILTEEHLPKLMAMSIVYGKTKNNPYRQLCTGINKYGEIRVIIEY